MERGARTVGPVHGAGHRCRGHGVGGGRGSGGVTGAGLLHIVRVSVDPETQQKPAFKRSGPAYMSLERFNVLKLRRRLASHAPLLVITGHNVGPFAAPRLVLLADALQLGQVLLPPASRAVDAVVDGEHDGHRDVEGRHGGEDGHVAVGLEELDVALRIRNVALALDVGPGEDPGRPQQDGDDPGCADHDAGAPRGALNAVGQRPGDAEVAVEADDDEVGHGRVAHGVVQRQPYIAHAGSQGPVAHQQVQRIQRHGHHADRQVRHGQAQQEVVAHRLQGLVHAEGHDDQQVAPGRHDGEDGHHDANQHHLERGVRQRP